MKLLKIPFFVLIWSLSANSSLSKENPILENQTDKSKNQELLRQLKEGQAVLSKAFVFKEQEPFCYIDLQDREDLLPPFAKPAPENFKSSVSFNKQTPC